ncbi:MAG: hypothetical protein KDB14_25415 [Planctomycetales bacterium]|nr:hypothetical protein [Planctomycetales bacterium]
MRDFEIYMQSLATTSYLLVVLLGSNLAVVLFRPERIRRRWAFKAGLGCLGLGVILPVIMSMSTAVPMVPGSDNTAVRVASFAASGMLLVASVLLSIGSLLPPLVLVPAKRDDRPPRNPFED